MEVRQDLFCVNSKNKVNPLTILFHISGISLSIQQFGEHIQLGVISDAQIHPLHIKLSDGWTKNLEKLF